jgi:hypothetical protein
MAMQTASWMVDGNPFNGQLARMMLNAAMAEQGGVIDALDFIVTATGLTNTVTIAPGGCVIPGGDTGATQQGNYYGFNVGSDTSVAVGATGGSVRTDMIVVRAEDPTFPGSPWSGSPAGQILYLRDIAGVTPGQTTVPAGISAIPLALVNMPASTSLVQQSYLVDIRQVARPMRQKGLQFLNGNTWSTPSNSPTVLATNTAWPASANWSIAIPTWATQMLVRYSLAGLDNPLSGAISGGTVFLGLGGTVAAPTQSSPVATHACPNGGYTNIEIVGIITIPPAMRGTTQTLTSIAVTTTTSGWLAANTNSNLALDYEFQQTASLT